MDATFFAFVGLLIFLGIVVYMKVPGTIAASLDKRADAIRNELSEAKRMREEAQALLADYQRKAKEAESEAESIVSEAKAEARRMTEETNKALAEMIERRTKAAEVKIAQAETQAVAEVRSIAADVAISAARSVLTSKVAGSTADALIAKGIADVKAKLN
jgi:F-type H+-transporting ATPase subunit b